MNLYLSLVVIILKVQLVMQYLTEFSMSLNDLKQPGDFLQLTDEVSEYNWCGQTFKPILRNQPDVIKNIFNKQMVC